MVVGVGRDVLKFFGLYVSTIIAFALCFHIAGSHKVTKIVHEISFKSIISSNPWSTFSMITFNCLSPNVTLGTFWRPFNSIYVYLSDDGGRV